MFDITEIKDVKKEIGLLVKTVRKNRGLSQIQLARSLDVSRTTIQNLELGKTLLLIRDFWSEGDDKVSFWKKLN